MRSFALATALIGLGREALAVQPTVHLDYSTYSGVVQGDGVTKWLGIRYAAPPTGNLRFAAPQDPPASNGIFNASAHGPTCLATGSSGLAAPQPTNASNEDCLFLDVYAPSNATQWSNLPVYFFIQVSLAVT